MPTKAVAKKSISQTKDCMKIGGFSLTKIISNRPKANAKISADDKEETNEILRVLGQKWNVADDNFCHVSPTTFS